MSKLGKNSIILLSIAIYIGIFLTFILKNYLKYAEFITASFMLLLTYFSILLLGYQKDKKGILKTRTIYIVISCIIVYFFISYMLGFVLGFLTNGYSLEFHSIIDNIFSPVIIIFSSEILRYVFICPNKQKKISIILLTILLVGIELTINAGVLKFIDLQHTFQSITMYIIPISLKHIVLSYITYQCGYKPSLMYRLAIDLYCYVIPIIPDLGDYLTIIFNISLPFAIFIYASSEIHSYNEQKSKEEEINNPVKQKDYITFPVIAFIFIFAILVSGIAPATIVGVASESMSPVIEKGDGVFVLKVKEESLHEQDVIVYQKGDKKIIHRIVEKENIDGKTIYKTKGDANNAIDELNVTYDEIVGKVNFKIPIIAYPSVYLNELMNK